MVARKKYVMRQVSKGRAYYYFRRKGMKPIRLPDNPASEEFDRAYWSIMSGRAFKAERSFEAIIADFKSLPRWKDLAPKTRKQYAQVFDYFIEKNGGADFTQVTRPDILDAMRANDHRPRFANSIAQVMSILCKHAMDIGWRKDNPAFQIRKMKTGKGYRPWTPGEIKAYRAAANGVGLLFFELQYGLGQRPQDTVLMTWADYDGRTIRVTQEKTGAEVWLYCPAALKAMLDEAKRNANGLTILTNAHGKPLTYDAAYKRMRAIVVDAGLQGVTPHGLRYNATQELAEAGNSMAEIKAVTGHTTDAMVNKYASGANKREMAERAQRRRAGDLSD